MNTFNNKTALDYRFLTREDVVSLLVQKDMELMRKDVELKQKETELVQKNAELEQKDAELEQKDAELARKSRRILELERMVFGRRSEKRLPESPGGGLARSSMNSGQRKVRCFTQKHFPSSTR